jgi:hypothetical protein
MDKSWSKKLPNERGRKSNLASIRCQATKE